MLATQENGLKSCNSSAAKISVPSTQSVFQNVYSASNRQRCFVLSVLICFQLLVVYLLNSQKVFIN